MERNDELANEVIVHVQGIRWSDLHAAEDHYEQIALVDAWVTNEFQVLNCQHLLQKL